jgi:ComF family protein
MERRAGRRPGHVSAGVLGLLFPGRCLLCGEWLSALPTEGSPVCPACIPLLIPLAGPRCAVCSMPLINEHTSCTRCRGGERSFISNFSVFPNEGAVKELILQYKSAGRVRLAGLFGRWLVQAAAARFPGLAVVPVPPRPGRMRPDGVERLARVLHRELGITILHALVRRRGPEQKGLSFEERRGNLKDQVRLAGNRPLPGKLLLLDDVFTTGATAETCAAALRSGGCGEVSVLTLAMEI